VRLPAAALTAALLSPALPTPAHAAPYAGVARGADATTRFRAADGTPWQLGLEVAYAVAGTDVQSRYLLVRLAQCDARRRCTSAKLWQQPLAVTELTPSPDGSTVSLSATVLGRKVAATWQTTSNEGTTIVVVPGSAHVEAVDRYGAKAEVTLAGATCTDSKATAYERRDANASGTPFTDAPKPPAAWPRGFSAKLRCA
jgi:hypothetical protein